MPSAKRFALRDTVRNHPVIVASSAASVGVLLGAFVAFNCWRRRSRASKAQPRRRWRSRPKGSRSWSGDKAGVRDHRLRPRRRPHRFGGLRAGNLALPLAPLHGGNAKQAPYPRDLDGQARQVDDRAIEASPPARPYETVGSGGREHRDCFPVARWSRRRPVGGVLPRRARRLQPSPSAAPSPPQPAANAEAKKEKRAQPRNPRREAPQRIPGVQAKTGSPTTTIRPSPAMAPMIALPMSDPPGAITDLPGASIAAGSSRAGLSGTTTCQLSNGDGPRRVTVIRRGGGGLFEGLFGD